MDGYMKDVDDYNGCFEINTVSLTYRSLQVLSKIMVLPLEKMMAGIDVVT